MSLVIKAIIPALNEEESLPLVIETLLSSSNQEWKLSEVIVVDNGSTDATAEVARTAGARVVSEKEKGYGAACLAGIAAAGETDYLLFIDADGSDYPEEWLLLAEAMETRNADLVIGSRVLNVGNNAGLEPHQRFGNRLASFLIGFKYNSTALKNQSDKITDPVTDLGPFRLIKTEVLQDINMQDRNFGWTVEMQLKALRLGYRVVEVPVSYRNRQGGKSKISGTLRGSYMAGKIILKYIFADYLNLSMIKTKRNKPK